MNGGEKLCLVCYLLFYVCGLQKHQTNVPFLDNKVISYLILSYMLYHASEMALGGDQALSNLDKLPF